MCTCLPYTLYLMCTVRIYMYMFTLPQYTCIGTHTHTHTHTHISILFIWPFRLFLSLSFPSRVSQDWVSNPIPSNSCRRLCPPDSVTWACLNQTPCSWLPERYHMYTLSLPPSLPPSLSPSLPPFLPPSLPPSLPLFSLNEFLTSPDIRIRFEATSYSVNENSDGALRLGVDFSEPLQDGGVLLVSFENGTATGVLCNCIFPFVCVSILTLGAHVQQRLQYFIHVFCYPFPST